MNFRDRTKLIPSLAAGLAIGAVLFPAVRASLLSLDAEARAGAAGPFGILGSLGSHLLVYGMAVWFIGAMLTGPVWFALTRGKGPFPLIPTLLTGSVTSSAVLVVSGSPAPGLAALAVALMIGIGAGAATWLFTEGRENA